MTHCSWLEHCWKGNITEVESLQAAQQVNVRYPDSLWQEAKFHLLWSQTFFSPFLTYFRSLAQPLKQKQFLRRCGAAITLLSVFLGGVRRGSDAEAIIVRLNLHSRFDLSGTSAPTSWLSVKTASGTAASRPFSFSTQSRLILLPGAELAQLNLCLLC